MVKKRVDNRDKNDITILVVPYKSLTKPWAVVINDGQGALLRMYPCFTKQEAYELKESLDNRRK